MVNEKNLTQKDCIKRLKEAIIHMDEDAANRVAKWIVEKHYDIKEAIIEGIISGMDQVSLLYDQEEYFIPDLLMCADAMNAALSVLEKKLLNEKWQTKGKIIIGTVEGNTHDIGKNIVALFLKSAGFCVFDLGRDVSAKNYYEAAMQFQPDIIILSSLMTTTMPNMKKVIHFFQEKNIRDQFYFMIGGKPTSKEYADHIGADAYSADAREAVFVAQKLCGSDKYIL